MSKIHQLVTDPLILSCVKCTSFNSPADFSLATIRNKWYRTEKRGQALICTARSHRKWKRQHRPQSEQWAWSRCVIHVAHHKKPDRGSEQIPAFVKRLLLSHCELVDRRWGFGESVTICLCVFLKGPTSEQRWIYLGTAVLLFLASSAHYMFFRNQACSLYMIPACTHNECQ